MNVTIVALPEGELDLALGRASDEGQLRRFTQRR